LIRKKLIRKGRKEQHLPDSCLQTAMELRKDLGEYKKPELSASTVTFIGCKKRLSLSKAHKSHSSG
jgi:hypothetical protein